MHSPNSRDTYTYAYREWVFPTLGFVLEAEAHEAMIESSGGSHGVENSSYLESALSAPLDSALGNDAYPGLFDKTAALCFRLAKNHGFVDGNKRTALITAAPSRKSSPRPSSPATRGSRHASRRA